MIKVNKSFSINRSIMTDIKTLFALGGAHISCYAVWRMSGPHSAILTPDRPLMTPDSLHDLGQRLAEVTFDPASATADITLYSRLRRPWPFSVSASSLDDGRADAEDRLKTASFNPMRVDRFDDMAQPEDDMNPSNQVADRYSLEWVNRLSQAVNWFQRGTGLSTSPFQPHPTPRGRLEYCIKEVARYFEAGRFDGATKEGRRMLNLIKFAGWRCGLHATGAIPRSLLYAQPTP